MSAAICNICGELFSYKGALNRQVCSCGNSNLSSVHAVVKFDNNEYQGVDYFDRKGVLRKTVPPSNNEVPRFTEWQR